MSETGHARNIERFAQLINFVDGYGADYDPANPAIALAALNAKKTDADLKMDTVTDEMTTWKMAVNDRQEAFEGIRKLATRIVNSLEASGASQKDIDDARTFKRKLDGARAQALVDDPNTPEDESQGNSVSQQSYTQLVEHFDNLIAVVNGSGFYNPNETELQTATLTAYSTALKTQNANVAAAAVPFSNARIARNNTLYAEGTGLVDLALLVKKYVKSLYGTDSPQYAQVSGLEFTRYKL